MIRAHGKSKRVLRVLNRSLLMCICLTFDIGKALHGIPVVQDMAIQLALVEGLLHC